MADNNENILKIQHTDGEFYSISEYMKLMEPEYKKQRQQIDSCIRGLVGYSAGMAAQGQQDRVSELRQLITEMTGFWFSAGEDFSERQNNYNDMFDRAVSEARDAGQAPELDAKTQNDILAGLELYSTEMTISGDLDEYIKQCDDLAEQMRNEWNAPEPAMGGMTFGQGI